MLLCTYRGSYNVHRLPKMCDEIFTIIITVILKIRRQIVLNN